MTKREKTLAALVGMLLVLACLFYGFRILSREFNDRSNQLRALEGQVRDKHRAVMFSQPAADRMRLYERRALPANVEKARSLYQTWLLKSVTDVGFQEPNVNVVASASSRDLYHQLGFTVSGRGNIKQLTEFLYSFYSADYLHRIRRLHAKRILGSKNLDVAMAIEALSLPTANHIDRLSNFPSGRLAQGERDDYLQAILARNLSGPPNQEPRIGQIGDRTVHTGDELSFEVAATDPDPLDRLAFDMLAPDLDDAQLDPRSGRFRWVPRQPGEYELAVSVSDDGFPPKTQTQTVLVTVTDPPPESPAPPEAKPSFDLARFAFVTAITNSGGRHQTWISLRTEGKMLRLHEGEQFNVGQVPVTVRQIDDRGVELEAAVLEKRFRVGLGQNLAEGRDILVEGT